MSEKRAPGEGLPFAGERKKEGAARVSSDVKHTLPNCTAMACRKKVPKCLYCCRDVNEIERRKTLPLVKGPDGLRRKYLGIRKADSSEGGS